jgi:D-arginine utilization repressor
MKPVSLSTCIGLCDAVAALLRPYGFAILTDDLSKTVLHVAGPAWRIKPGDPVDRDDDVVSPVRERHSVIGPHRKTLPDGRTLRIVSVPLNDDHNKPIGHIRIGLDITPFETARQALARLQLNAFPQDHETARQKPADWQAGIDDCIAAAMTSHGASIDNLTAEQLADVIADLEREGYFTIRNAMPYISKTLNRSRAAVYNHLQRIRNKNSILT